MNTAMFLPIVKIIQARRPNWTVVMEDARIRIQTMQFAVNWDIVEEIIDAGDYKMEEIIMHQSLGIVLNLRHTGGE